jgi:hypothetical protein
MPGNTDAPRQIKKHTPLWLDLLLTPVSADGTSTGADVVQALVRLARGQDQIITLLENLQMALSQDAQAIVDKINTTTNKVGAAITTATTAIKDLAAKVAAGTIDPTEFSAAVQPALDTLDAGADAMTKTATDNDPALNPSAPPIVVPETPVP